MEGGTTSVPVASNPTQTSVGHAVGEISQVMANEGSGTSGSPWEDDLPPEQPKAPVAHTVGSFDGHHVVSDAETTSFTVPAHLEEKVGQKVPATQYAGTVPPVAPSQPRSIDGIAPIGRPPIITQANNTTGGANVTMPIPTKQPISLAGKLFRARPHLNLAVGEAKVKSVLPVVAGLGVFFLLFAMVAGTEMGILPFGLEKVYGAVGLEKIWGGLSKNPEGALIRSGVAMRQYSDFKATGSLVLTIDKSIKSQITSPLVAIADLSSRLAHDESINAAIPASLTQSSTNSYYDASNSYYGSTTTGNYYTDSAPNSIDTNSVINGSTTTSSGNSLETSATLDSTTVNSAASSTSAVNGDEEQTTNPGYQYTGPSIKEVGIDVSALFGKDGNEADLRVNKVTGSYDVELKNRADLLWVKSDSRLKFNSAAKQNKWLEYSINSMSNRLIQHDVVPATKAEGFSVKGTRIGSEKIGKVRTYHYKLSSIKLGSLLAPIGITDDMVTSASGDVWIGINDKLIRKVNLKITPGNGSSVTLITLVLEFSDYGVANSFSVPSVAEIIKPTSSSTQTLTGDAKRKSDLAKIKEALLSYRQSYGSYPVTQGFVNLNKSSELLTSKLVPTYLEELPLEVEKAKEGWYYSYKSDGIGFTLGTRLESAFDPDVEIANGMNLYFLKDR